MLYLLTQKRLPYNLPMKGTLIVTAKYCSWLKQLAKKC